MRALLMLLIGLAVLGGLVYYVYGGQMNGAQAPTEKAAPAKNAADAYKANQEKMMRELGQ